MRENQERFTALVHAWSADLYRFAFWLSRDRARAEDLVQETFLRAWRALASLRDEQAAKSWLFTILRREHFRRGPVTLPTVELEELAEEPAHRHDSTQDWVVRRQIVALPEEYREPLLLQVLGGMSCEEIATELGISKAAVMTRLFRARQKLRATLNGEPATEWPEVHEHELP
jgi:RNA polymerase sigma-70 factor (ECF subfamily)